MTAARCEFQQPLRQRNASGLAVAGIRRLSELTGVTPRALRYYEARGLLTPSRTASGARVFSAHQCDLAALIVLLRGLDVPVGEIEILLKMADSEEARVHGLRKALARRADDLARRLDDVRRALEP